MRNVLPTDKIDPVAQNAIKTFHSDIVEQAQEAVTQNAWVVIGMAQNPVVKSARQLLDSQSIQYKYISHGNYLSKWKERLAIKLWSGWPTFPQVFHKGILIGGFKDLKTYLDKTAQHKTAKQ